MKLLKLPKKPSAKASLATLKKYVARVDEIKRINAQKLRDEKERKALKEKIKMISASTVQTTSLGSTTRRRKKKTTVAKKSTRKRK